MLWTPKNLEQIVSWVESAYPEEGCGLILQKPDGAYEVMCCENLANKYHEVDPKTYPRSARTFYMINPIEFVRAERRGDRVAVVFHSHADVGDYFSDEDVAGATLPRFEQDAPLEPAHPGTDFLVISVRDGVADHGTVFCFDDARGLFQAQTTIAIAQGVFDVTLCDSL